MNRIVMGKCDWNELFEPHSFFAQYRNYLQIVASSDSDERQLKWDGLVESRLRQLIPKLESIEHVRLAHPYVQVLRRQYSNLDDQQTEDAAHGIAPKQTDAPAGTRTICTSTFYIGLGIEPKPGNETTGLLHRRRRNACS